MKTIQYDVHPSIGMVQKWLVELPQKTGRSIDQWIELLQSQGPTSESERRGWLKAEHALPTLTATWIAERSVGKGTEEDSPEAYLQAAEIWVETMFAGKKAALRPIYDTILRIVKDLGPDIRISPGKTIVPFYRKRVFAQVKPATNSRIDLGLALGTTPPSGRLIDTGGFAKQDRITHRIPIASLKEIDDEVLKWLQCSYDKDA